MRKNLKFDANDEIRYQVESCKHSSGKRIYYIVISKLDHSLNELDYVYLHKDGTTWARMDKSDAPLYKEPTYKEYLSWSGVWDSPVKAVCVLLNWLEQ